MKSETKKFMDDYYVDRHHQGFENAMENAIEKLVEQLQKLKEVINQK